MNANLFFLVERADYGCRCSWRQCHNVWRQISLRIDPIMCWINGGVGANVHNRSCRSVAFSSGPVSEGWRRNLGRFIRDVHILLLTIYWVACKSKGKACQGSLGVVMQSQQGQHRSSEACQGSIGAPYCHVPAAFKGGNLAEPVPFQVQR